MSEQVRAITPLLVSIFVFFITLYLGLPHILPQQGGLFNDTPMFKVGDCVVADPTKNPNKEQWESSELLRENSYVEKIEQIGRHSYLTSFCLLNGELKCRSVVKSTDADANQYMLKVSFMADDIKTKIECPEGLR